MDNDMDNELGKLLKGNERYLMQQQCAKNFECMSKQKPFAIIVTCSDSRVVPELIFDVNIGELFVIRIAGNVVGNDVLGSIEYAVKYLHVPLIVVLGHEGCGAVNAVWDTSPCEHANKDNIRHILKKIKKPVNKVKEKDGNIGDAIIENVKEQITTIMTKSPICAEFVDKNKLTIIGMIYSISNGGITIIPNTNTDKSLTHADFVDTKKAAPQVTQIKTLKN